MIKKNIFTASLLLLTLICVFFSGVAYLKRENNATTAQSLYYFSSKSVKDEELIRKFADNYELYLFYSSSCHYCVKFAPVISKFVSSHNIKLLPISMDNRGVPYLTNPLPYTQKYSHFDTSRYPVLYAVNKHTKKTERLVLGYASDSELRQIITSLMADA